MCLQRGQRFCFLTRCDLCPLELFLACIYLEEALTPTQPVLLLPLILLKSFFFFFGEQGS